MEEDRRSDQACSEREVQEGHLVVAVQNDPAALGEKADHPRVVPYEVA
jgi:hypothetical protein